MKPIWNRTFNFIGRTGVALFAIILFIHGSTKNSTNVNNDAELEVLGDVMSVADEFELSARLQDSPVAEESAAEAALLWVLVGVVTNVAAKYTMSTNAMAYRPWAVRGGFQDRFWLDFGEWTFPLGANEYSRVAVSTWGEVWSEWNDEEKKIAAVGVPMAAVPGVSMFWWAEGENDSRILTWKDFALNRDTNTLVSAQMVLKANGDFTLCSNEVVRLFQRVETFEWDGKTVGQTDEERARVAAEVGVGLENGYYRFRATFPKAPRRRTLLTVGTNRVVVTAAGDYDFLLEKGIEYTFGTEPVNTNVIYTAVDDVPRENDLMMAMANDYWYSSGYWTIGGGWLRLIYPTEYYLGRIVWLPKLEGSPDLPHFWPGNDSVVLVANLEDCLDSSRATYHWSANGGVIFSSPDLPVTRATVTRFPIWDEHLTFKVTATIGTNVLVSTATTSWGQTENEPSFGFSFSAATTGGVILFEDEYENSPGETVERTSTFQEINLSCCSGRETTDIEIKLETGAGLIALHEDSTNGPTVSLPWRTSLKKYESLTKKFYVEALAASSSENDICLKASARNGTSTYTEEAKFTAIEIITKAVETWPTNRNRHVFGPKEEVTLRQKPQTPIVSFEARLDNHGKVFSSTNGTTLTIPYQPCSFRVVARAQGGALSIPFTCVAPSTLKAKNPRGVLEEEWYASGIRPLESQEAGVLMHLDTYLEPQTVSFRHLRLFEGFAPAANKTGWFLDDSTFKSNNLDHTIEAGASSDPATDFANIGDYNETENGDYVGMVIGARQVYSNGSFQVSIPLYWYTENATITNSLPANLQTIQVFENGTMRVTKFGITWERALDGAEQEIKGVK